MLWVAYEEICDHGSYHATSPLLKCHMPYLIHMYVKEMLLVIHSLNEALQLADGSPVNHKHVCNSNWLVHRGLDHFALIPLDHRTNLPCRD